MAKAKKAVVSKYKKSNQGIAKTANDHVGKQWSDLSESEQQAIVGEILVNDDGVICLLEKGGTTSKYKKGDSYSDKASAHKEIGYFTDGGKKFINLEVPEESPNREGVVVGKRTMKTNNGDVEFADVKFRDLTEGYLFEKDGVILKYDADIRAAGGSVGGFDYKTVNTRTAKGLKDAEKLKREGWKIISSGTETIQFERAKKASKYAKGGDIVGGRGFFGLEKGERITSISQINKGDIILSSKANSNNTYKVIDKREYGDEVKFDIVYWNPTTNKRIGDEEMSLNYFDLHEYYKPKEEAKETTESEKYVIVSEKHGGYYILTKPVSKERADALWDTFTDGLSKDETPSIITVAEAKAKKHVVGKEYLDMEVSEDKQSAEEVWNNWSEEQRKSFIKAHIEKTDKKDINKFWMSHANGSYANLVKSLKDGLDEHLKEAKGKFAAGDIRRVVKDTEYYMDGRQLSEAQYAPSDSMEFYDDETDTYYNRSGQQLRNPLEYEPDEDGTYEPFGDEGSGEYARGGETAKSKIKKRLVGKEQHTVQSKASKNMKFIVYEYDNGKYIVAAKFSGYPEHFVEEIFNTYGDAIKNAEQRAEAPKLANGGVVDKDKFAKVMSEWGKRKLKDSHGNTVEKQGQALAIAYSVAGENKMAAGGEIGDAVAGIVGNSKQGFEASFALTLDTLGLSDAQKAKFKEMLAYVQKSDYFFNQNSCKQKIEEWKYFKDKGDEKALEMSEEDIKLSFEYLDYVMLIRLIAMYDKLIKEKNTKELISKVRYDQKLSLRVYEILTGEKIEGKNNKQLAEYFKTKYGEGQMAAGGETTSGKYAIVNKMPNGRYFLITRAAYTKEGAEEFLKEYEQLWKFGGDKTVKSVSEINEIKDKVDNIEYLEKGGELSDTERFPFVLTIMKDGKRIIVDKYVSRAAANKIKDMIIEEAKPKVEDNKGQFAAGGEIGEGNNTYVAFYKGKQQDVKANTSLEAQKTAAAHFKAKKSWEVTVVLGKKGDEVVVHSTAEFKKGGETEDKLLPAEYYKEFSLKGNGRRKYTIFSGGMGSDYEFKQAVKQIFPTMSKEEHKKLAEKYHELYKKSRKEYNEYADAEFEKKFGRKFEATDYKVSGVIRDEFAPEVKDKLRDYVKAMNAYERASELHNSVLLSKDKIKYEKGGEMHRNHKPSKYAKGGEMPDGKDKDLFVSEEEAIAIGATKVGEDESNYDNIYKIGRTKYIAVDGILHTLSKGGEPDYPVRKTNFKEFSPKADAEIEKKAAAIKNAVKIATIAMEHNIRTEGTLEEFAHKIFDETKISYGKADLDLAYRAMKGVGYANGGKIASKKLEQMIVECHRKSSDSKYKKKA